MDVAEAISALQTTQNVLQALATTLTMTAYLFPPQANISDGETFDYIVVGSGSAGSIIASRLTEDPNVRVLLVEAGGDPPLESVLPAYMTYLPRTRVDWNYTSVRDDIQKFHKNEVMELTTGKMLGGSSSNNYMLYVRGSPVDYNTWANIVENPSWNYKNTLPYFKKTENLKDEVILNSQTGIFYGTNGNVGVIKQRLNITHKYLNAFKEGGHKVVLDTIGNMTLGYCEPLYNIDHGIRQSTAYSFLGPAKNRPNLYVAKYTLVTRIIFDNNNTAIAVEALNEHGDNITLKANKEIILSAGTIKTPQLLMLSGIGPRQHLEDMEIKVMVDLPVGENFQNHNAAVLVYPTEAAPPKKPINPHSLALPMILGYVAMNRSQNYPDYQAAILIGDTDSLLQLCGFIFSFRNKICQKFYDRSKGKEVLFTAVIGLHPKSRGRILLRSSNPLHYPLISLNTYSDKRDLEDMISYVQDFDRVTGSKYFQSVNSKLLDPPQCESLVRSSKAYWRCIARTMSTSLHHYVGTCAMGSVVDSRLRVNGVNRLRVADGSVIPTITRGNTNAPIMMIGEKAADMIKEHYIKY